MSNPKRASMTGGSKAVRGKAKTRAGGAAGGSSGSGASGPSASRLSVLASLRATQIITSKAALPAEILALVLEYLPIADQFRMARVSRRMQEMVYDDTRWTSRLKSMGCWNDAEARQRFEESIKRKAETQRAREAEERRRTGVGLSGSVNGIAGGGGGGKSSSGGGADGGWAEVETRKPVVPLFDAGWEEGKLNQRAIQEQTVRLDTAFPRPGIIDTAFEVMTLSPETPSVAGPSASDLSSALNVLNQVRSIRGRARQEYGKVYAALAPYYFNLAQATSHTDAAVFQVYRDPEQQAQMLAQLRMFGKSDFALGWSSRLDQVDSMVGLFENAALREFEQGYAAQDIDGRMRRYAHVLVTLNGGAAAVDYFIQNHPLMSQRQLLGNPMDCLRRASSGIVSLEPSHDFFRRIAATINEQSNIIDRVFPSSISVLEPFVERVSEEVITEYITPLLSESRERNVEAFLKVMSGVFRQSILFSNALQPTRNAPKDYKDQVFKTIAAVFKPHVYYYVTEELAFFKAKADAEVKAWEKRLSDEAASTESIFMANINRQVVKRDFLSSFKKMVMMPVNAFPTIPMIPLSSPFTLASKRQSTAATFTGDSFGLPPSRPMTPSGGERTPTPQPDAPNSELAAKVALMNSRLEGIKGLFSMEVAISLVHAAKGGLERAAPFARLEGRNSDDAKHLCETIFVQLLHVLGNGHIKMGFEKALSHLSSYNAREVAEHNQAGVEPLVTFLELVNVGDLIQQMVDVFYVQELLTPRLVDRDDFLNPAGKAKKKFEQMLDEHVAAGLNKGIDVLMDEVEYVCAVTQKPEDFNPTSPAFDIGPSETATKVVKIVSSHVDMLVGSTDKNVLEVFNQEMGVRLFGALCKHLKRQRISVEGAIKLIRYVFHARAYTKAWNCIDPFFFFQGCRG